MGKNSKKLKRRNTLYSLSTKNNISRNVLYIDVTDGKLETRVNIPPISKESQYIVNLAEKSPHIRKKTVNFNNSFFHKKIADIIKNETGLLIRPIEIEKELKGIYPPIGIRRIIIIKDKDITELK